MLSMNIEISPGSNIYTAIKQMKDISIKLSIKVNSEFNGTKISVLPTSEVDDIFL